MPKQTCSTLLATACLAALVGCGGGAGDGTGVAGASTATPLSPASNTYALAAGFQGRLASGASDRFVVSGTCSGTASIATSAAVPSTFAGVPGYAAAQLSTLALSNCTVTAGSQMGTTYFDSLAAPIGLNILNGEYAQLNAPATDLPVSVAVGDAGVISTQNTYADSTRAVPTGTLVLSYVIEANTAATATATVNMITRAYDVSNELLSTQQSRYALTTGGALTLSSIDVQFSTTSTLHLLYTPS